MYGKNIYKVHFIDRYKGQYDARYVILSILILIAHFFYCSVLSVNVLGWSYVLIPYSWQFLTYLPFFNHSFRLLLSSFFTFSSWFFVWQDHILILHPFFLHQVQFIKWAMDKLFPPFSSYTDCSFLIVSYVVLSSSQYIWYPIYICCTSLFFSFIFRVKIRLFSFLYSLSILQIRSFLIAVTSPPLSLFPCHVQYCIDHH